VRAAVMPAGGQVKKYEKMAFQASPNGTTTECLPVLYLSIALKYNPLPPARMSLQGQPPTLELETSTSPETPYRTPYGNYLGVPTYNH